MDYGQFQLPTSQGLINSNPLILSKFLTFLVANIRFAVFEIAAVFASSTLIGLPFFTLSDTIIAYSKDRFFELTILRIQVTNAANNLQAGNRFCRSLNLKTLAGCLRSICVNIGCNSGF